MANKKSTKSPEKAKKTTKKPGFIARAKAYMASVRSEMKRVVWPTKNELVNYTIAVCLRSSSSVSPSLFSILSSARASCSSRA